MPAPSLLSIAQRGCTRNIALLWDMADMPYHLLAPILRKISNPEQLRAIEAGSPQIADSSAELWQAFIARDIPACDAAGLAPADPRAWGKVYRRLRRAAERERAAQEARLRSVMRGLSAAKEAQQVQIVHAVIPEGLGAARKGLVGVDRSGWSTASAVERGIVRAAKSGHDVITALKKQSSNAQQRRGFGRAPLRGSVLEMPASQIRKAPASMVADHTRAAVPAAALARTNGPAPKFTPARGFAPGRGATAQDQALNLALRAEQAEKEKRLRALTNPGARALKTDIVAGGGSGRGAETSPTSPETPLEARQRPKNMARTVASSGVQRTHSPSRGAVAAAGVRKRPAVSAFVPVKKRKV